MNELFEQLHSPDLDTRLAAIHALGQRKDPAALDHLIPLLNDPSMEIRLATIEALAEIGDERAIDALLQIQQDVESAVQVAATLALTSLVKRRLQALETLMDELYILDMPEEKEEAEKNIPVAPPYGQSSVAPPQPQEATKADIDKKEQEEIPVARTTMEEQGGWQDTLRRQLSSSITPSELNHQIKNPQFSAFFPQQIQADSPYALLVFAHIEAVLDEVRAEAGKFAPLLGGQPAESTVNSLVEIQGGTILTYVPIIEGIEFTPKQHSVIWNPAKDMRLYHSTSFLFQTPAVLTGDLSGRVLIFDGALVIGEIPLRLSMQASTGESGFNRYDPIFASYSHKDTPVMEYFRRRRADLGQKMLVDIYDLRAGDHWADRLLQMIDQSAVFQLFWSSYSAESVYCRKEWEYALKHLTERPRFIQPVWWQDPMHPPPSELADLHFQKVQLPPVTRLRVLTKRIQDFFGG